MAGAALDVVCCEFGIALLALDKSRIFCYNITVGFGFALNFL